MENRIYKEADNRLKTIFISIVIGMLVAHGTPLFNKFAIHDESLNLFDLGLRVESGRWGVELLGYFVPLFFGESGGVSFFSMPLMAGFYITLFLSLSVFFIVKLMDIKSLCLCSILGLLFITYPYMAILFSFNFIISYYVFSFFLSVLGAYFFCKGKGKKYFFAGIVSVVFSLSLYQAFFPITIALILLSFIKEIRDNETATWKSFLLKGFRFLIFCCLSMSIYIGISYLFLHLYNMQLTEYQNIDKMGKEGWLYLKRIGVAYREFFNPKTSFQLNTKYIYYFILLFCLILQACQCVFLPLKKVCQITVLLLLFPLAVNFIYIMCPHDDSAYYRIVNLAIWCGHLMVFVYFVFLLENIGTSKAGIIRMTGNVCLSVMILMCCRIDNICYFQALFQQERAINWFTSLIAQIKNTEGYKQSYPVAFLNEFNKWDNNIKNMPFLEPAIPPYWGTKWAINNYAWKKFVANWCAYEPILASGRDFENLPEVQAMPRYPDYGSIKVINNTVVVKF